MNQSRSNNGQLQAPQGNGASGAGNKNGNKNGRARQAGPRNASHGNFFPAARTFGQRVYDWLFGRGRELPLQADGIAIALAALLGVMVYLAALGMASSIVLGTFTTKWESARAGEFTIEISPLPARASGDAPSLTTRVTAALQALKSDASVAKATPLSEVEMRRLLTPWLGDKINFQDLPLPVLISVEMRDGASPNALADLTTRLERAIPGLRVDDHGAWLQDLRQFVSLLQGVAWAVILLLGLGAALTVILVTRVSLLAHRDVVDILHIMGATDLHIAWQFQTFVARIAVIGSACGALFAFVTLLFAQLWGLAVHMPLLPFNGLSWWHFVVIVALPLPTTLLATLVARISVRWWIRQLP